MSRFGRRLKYLRENKGLSQQQLADDLNISRSTIGNYELGSREPNFEILEEFADYFNVDMDFLTGKSDIERKIPILNDKPDDKPSEDTQAALQTIAAALNLDLVDPMQYLTPRERALLSSFSLLTDDMQQSFLDLIKSVAKGSPSQDVPVLMKPEKHL